MTTESKHEVGEDVTERARQLVAAKDTATPENRALPTDMQSEIAVLVTSMRSTWCVDMCISIVTAEMFASHAHRAIWKAIVALRKSGDVVDPVTAQGWLSERGRLEAVGGVAYFNTILSTAAEDASAEIYAKTVRRLSVRRNIITTCERLAREGYADASDEYSEKVEREIFAAARSSKRRETLVRLRDAAVRLGERFSSGAVESVCVPTGLAPLDEKIVGFRRSHLVIVGARPGMGKSAFMGGAAVAAARYVTGHGGETAEASASLVMSAEMDAEEVAARMLAAEAKVSVGAMTSGAAILSETTKHAVNRAAFDLAQLPLWIDEKAAPTLEHIRSAIRRVKAECERVEREDGLPTRLRVVFVDYIQICGTAAEKGKNRDREISEFTAALKQIAKEEDLCVVALSQLNRGVEARPNKRPLMSDLRESGGIEQDADIVLFLYRDEYYNEDSKAKGLAEIIIAKRRGGEAGHHRALVRWDGRYTMFRNFTDLELRQLDQEAAEAPYEPPPPPRTPRRLDRNTGKYAE